MSGVMLNGNLPVPTIVNSFFEDTRATFNQLYENVNGAIPSEVLNATQNFTEQVSGHLDGFGYLQSAMETSKDFINGDFVKALLNFPLECLDAEEILFDKTAELVKEKIGPEKLNKLLEELKTMFSDSQKDSDNDLDMDAESADDGLSNQMRPTPKPTPS